MSASIEERVVSIKFDNSKFEANVKTTMTSLENLKKSMDFSGSIKALSELDAAGKNIGNIKFDNKAFADSVQSTVTVAQNLKKELKFDGAVKSLSELDAAGKNVKLEMNPKPFQEGAKGVIEAANTIKQNLNFASVQAGIGSLKSSIQGITFEQIVNGSKNAIKSLQELDLAGRQVNFNSIGINADMANQRISAMSVAGIAALGALGVKAALVGAQMASSLIVDPAKSGLAEYETNLNSIQTILANTQSKGSTITDVNAALEELNTYSDQTIYNFAEMAKAIGTFTTAGVDLDTSTDSIKGLSNVAAMSGANSTQAASAMEQLSRALSSGKVQLQDWMSIETAGMASESFRESLMETARQHGVGIDAMVEKQGSFRNTLQEGWLTTDIMTETLSKFTGDLTDAQLQQMGYNAEQIASIQKMAETANAAATKVKTFTQLMGTLQEASGSGWAKSAQLVLGDFEQAREMWTNVNNVLGGMVKASADERNKVLGDWNQLGGRTHMIEAVTNAFNGLMGILNPINEAFREVFPPMTGERLFKITEAIRDFTRTLIPSQEQTSLLKNTFKLLFTIIKMGLDILGGAIGIVVAFFRAFATGGESLNGSLKPITDALANITKKIQESQFIEKFFAALTVAATNLGNVMRSIVGFIVNVGIALYNIVDAFLSAYNWMGFVEIGLDALKEGFEFFGRILNFLINDLDRVGAAIRDAAIAFAKGGFGAAVDAFKASMNGLGDMGEMVFARIIERVESLKRFADRLARAWDEVVAALGRLWEKLLPIREAISTLFGDLGRELEKVFTDVNYDDTLDMVNTGLLAGLFLLFKGFFKKLTGMGDGVKDDLMKHLTTSVEGINDVLESLTGTLGAMQQNLQADTLMKIAIAIGILAISVIALSLIDSGALTKSLVAIGVMVVILSKAMEALDKISIGSGFLKLPFIAGSMILLAIALAILVIPVKQLSELSWGELIKGLTGTIVLMMGLAKAAEIMSKNPANLIATGVGLIAVAIAIKILASAVKDISELSFGEMIQGLIGVGTLLAALSIFNNMTKVNKGAMANAAGLILLGIALKIMASAMGDFAAMDIGSLIQGLVTLGLVLALLQRFTTVVSGADILKTAAAIVVLGVALKIIASAMNDFAALSWENTAKGLIIMSVALKSMSQALARVPPNMLTSAVGFIAIAAALKILASALQDFAGMSWEEIAKGMAVLAGSLILLSVALIAMQGTLSGAAAMVVASAALLILGQALTVFGNMSWEQMLHGFAALAGVFVIFGLAGLIMAPIVPVLFSLGVAIGMLGLGLMGIGLGTALFAAGLVVIATAVMIAGPILVAFIASLLALIPVALAEFGKGIVAFADVIGGAMPTFLQAFVALLQTLLTAIQMVFPQLMDTLWMVIVGLVGLIVRGIPLFVDAGMKIIIGILQGIGNNMGQLLDAATRVITEFLDGLARNLPKIIDSGVKLIVSFVQGLADGVRNNSAAMSDAGWDLASAIVEGMVNGIAEGVGRVITAAQNLAGDAINAAKRMLGINSPSKVFYGFGKWVDEGFANGVDRYAYLGAKSTKAMGTSAVKAFNKSIAGIESASSMGLDMVPTIRPVLDLSAIRKDSGLVAGMLAVPALAIAGTYDKASSLAAADRVRRESIHGVTTSEAVTSGPSVVNNYTQNLTSPKALNSAEIYRQNKNLISVVKKGTPVAG